MDLRLLVLWKLIIQLFCYKSVYLTITNSSHPSRSLDQVRLTCKPSLQPCNSSISRVIFSAEAEIDDNTAERESNTALSDIGGKYEFIFYVGVEKMMIEFV